MKKFIIGKCMNIVKKYHSYDDTKLAEIEYGLVGIYLTITKMFVISIACLVLGIFKEMFLFMLIYGVLRTFSFGIHATKSWMCWIASSIIFIGFPILCIYVNMDNIFKLIIGSVFTILMFKNSPADTKKRPIVNKKRRWTYKIISTLLAIIYVTLSIIISNNFISNCFIFGLVLQNILISPLTYKIFNQPYNNYKEFLKLHPNFLN